MMTEVINLHQQRKAKARVEKEKKAAENHIKYGRTKKEKQKDKRTSERAEKHLEGHKRETEDE